MKKKRRREKSACVSSMGRARSLLVWNGVRAHRRRKKSNAYVGKLRKQMLYRWPPEFFGWILAKNKKDFAASTITVRRARRLL